MKQLLLIRHAKSSWENFAEKDEDRPLTARGIKNAHEMARRLLERGIKIDLFLTSPAKRARTTAELFAAEYGVEKSLIQIIPQLYRAGEKAFLQTIRAVPGDPQTIALFSHNNGITQFANVLSSASIDHMPTCSIFTVKCPVGKWSDFQTRVNEFDFFDRPKG